MGTNTLSGMQNRNGATTRASYAKVIEEVLPREGRYDAESFKHSLWVLTDREIEAGIDYILQREEEDLCAMR